MYCVGGFLGSECKRCSSSLFSCQKSKCAIKIVLCVPHSFLFILLFFFLYLNQSPQVHKRSSFICTNVYAGNTKTFSSVNVFFQGSNTPNIKYITIISSYKELCEKYKDIFKSNNYFPNTVVSFTNQE